MGSIPCDRVSSVWADVETGPAADTVRRTESEFLVRHDAFRIVAPRAVQRTPFEKDGCPDAWTIEEREPLDVKD